MKEMMKNALNKVKDVWKLHGREIALFIGVIVVGVVGFEVGFIEGQSVQSKPLVVTASLTPLIPVAEPLPNTQIVVKQASANTDTKIVNADVIDVNCAFVGSKNSNKYHLAKCSFAKRIKAENRVCFTSAEDAQSKGYQAGCVK
jgi:tetrahydromethanopterin S-methyltransferase subunit F